MGHNYMCTVIFEKLNEIILYSDIKHLTEAQHLIQIVVVQRHTFKEQLKQCMYLREK